VCVTEFFPFYTLTGNRMQELDNKLEFFCIRSIYSSWSV
jgi:hypothetical protein